MVGELSGVLQIAISVKEIERATAFYRDTLGLSLLMNGPNMAFLDCGGIRIYLDANPGSAEAGGNSLVYFRSTNIDRTHASFQDSGLTIHRAPHIIANLPDRDIWLMWIRDSESTLLGIMEERRK
jgi:catechol 2,3-dioxygenase-like lactoylglutathione lyase family enzyme